MTDSFWWDVSGQPVVKRSETTGDPFTGIPAPQRWACLGETAVVPSPWIPLVPGKDPPGPASTGLSGSRPSALGINLGHEPQILSLSPYYLCSA